MFLTYTCVHFEQVWYYATCKRGLISRGLLTCLTRNTFYDLIITLKKRNIYQIHENIYMGHFKQGLESSSYEIELRSYVMIS